MIDKYPAKIFIESISVELPNSYPKNFGYSVELNLWTDDPEDMKTIIEQKEYFIKKYNLEHNKFRKYPVQKFTYEWIKQI